jgi:carbonic anhydrase/acetyltransferase-like protein (isoleucine patch superfamily)
MPIYALGSVEPQVHPDAYVHPDAVVIGDVRIGARASIWPGAVLRGDYDAIAIGEATSIQDGAVIHAGSGAPTAIGARCVVGHMAHLEGCRVDDGCLIGTAAVVLHEVVVGAGATVGANALVAKRMVVPPGALAVGVPARIVEGASRAEEIRSGVEGYLGNARRYAAELRRLA